MELVRSSISIDCGLPCEKARSAPATIFSRPAQRSLTLWPARSPSRQATLYTESSDSFVASAAVSIATGWSEPVPGRELHPLKSSAFHGALLRQLSRSLCRIDHFSSSDRRNINSHEGPKNLRQTGTGCSLPDLWCSAWREMRTGYGPGANRPSPRPSRDRQGLRAELSVFRILELPGTDIPTVMVQ